MVKGPISLAQARSAGLPYYDGAPTSGDCQGLIDRPTQIRLILDTVLATMQQGALTSVTLAVLLVVFPWLAAPLSFLGIVGLGKVSLDLFHAFWDGLSPAQQQELQLQAQQDGVDLARFLGQGSETRPA